MVSPYKAGGDVVVQCVRGGGVPDGIWNRHDAAEVGGTCLYGMVLMKHGDKGEQGGEGGGMWFIPIALKAVVHARHDAAEVGETNKKRENVREQGKERARKGMYSSPRYPKTLIHPPPDHPPPPLLPIPLLPPLLLPTPLLPPFPLHPSPLLKPTLPPNRIPAGAPLSPRPPTHSQP
ncbi:unnamed protein product [Closterium sp. NIES-54]